MRRKNCNSPTQTYPAVASLHRAGCTCTRETALARIAAARQDGDVWLTTPGAIHAHVAALPQLATGISA